MRYRYRLALIAAGYALSLAGGVAAVELYELSIPADVSQSSGGMVAFADMVVFVLVAGFLGLAPTWFVLRLCAEQAPRLLLAVLLLVAAVGPLSWLAVVCLAGPGGLNLPEAGRELLGLLIAFGAMPRIVAGPIVMVLEGLTLLIARQRGVRALLAAAMLLDLVPLGMFALHLAAAIHR